MGAGGRMSVDTPLKKKDVSARVPTAKPPFTLSQLKKAIPPHCFQRSILKSFSYTISDLTIVSILYYLATTYIPLLPHPFLQYFIAWPIYWAAQGCFLTGVWVIAHECGHQAFSDYGLLNDIVGYILHTALLAPYYSWKYSHRRHHSNTASLEHDEVYVPRPKSKIAPIYKYLNNPPGRFLTLFVSLTMGWPLYLAFNVSGRSYDRWASHFDPYGPIYNGRERFNIFITDLGFLAVLYAVFRMMVARGVGWVLCVYGVPVLVTNGFLVLITYLQHTHISLPHYDSSEWNWLRGALSTVDRDFGVLNKVFHNITDTHVTHHLFSNMPHYHAMEATKAMLPILGDYYQYDGTPFYKAMWREARECIYVEPDEGSEDKGVFWYRSKF